LFKTNQSSHLDPTDCGIRVNKLDYRAGPALDSGVMTAPFARRATNLPPFSNS